MSRSSTHACPDRRDTLVAVAAGEAMRDLALEAHLIACGGCNAFLASVQTQVRALRGLTPLPAPRELHGLVVAATQAGHRQERAVAALRSIGRATMPPEVDHAIWPIGVSAPPVLDDLVNRSLQDPTHSFARRFAGRIERLSAPRDLDARVGKVYEFGAKRRERAARRLAFATAALVLVGITVTATWLVARSGEVTAAEPQFVIERVTSPEAFDPLWRSTLSGLLGGAPDADRIVREKKL
ncbi:MAG: hypothetical protein SGI72_11620 [Planctomycetota bacterium]|nr:hypothetical protein [Planctomycetota bacterium]